MGGRRILRIITRVIVFLLLGAIINVAVAWGLCRTPLWRLPATRISPQVGAQVWWRANALETFPRDRRLMEVMQWRRLANRHWAMSTYTHHADRFESGWPLYALERSHWTHYLSTFEDRDALALAPWLADFLGTQYLPLRPIWPGFAINTIFYAAILWLLFAALFAVRRWRRVKRGLCPACAYPVGDSPACTECGGPL